MNKVVFLSLLIFVTLACREEVKSSQVQSSNEPVKIVEKIIDTIIVREIEKVDSKKSARATMEDLKAKGFTIFDYVDEKTKDTVIMQQYFMAFLKSGPIRGQNEEETAELQKAHLAHLGKMYDLGYADISGPFGDDGDIRGVTVYNVPTLKMADSLANADPMVKAGRLVIEIHPWWAGKGYLLR